MAGVSVEATLELWAFSLWGVKARMRSLRHEQVAASAGKFLAGFLGNEPRKTGWMWAETAGDPGPWRWDTDALRDVSGGACRQAKEPKGPRLHDWAYVELADLDAGEYYSTLAAEWTGVFSSTASP